MLKMPIYLKLQELYPRNMSEYGDPDRPDVDTCLWTDDEVCPARSRVERCVFCTLIPS